MTGYKYEFIAERWLSVEGDGVVSIEFYFIFLTEKGVCFLVISIVSDYRRISDYFVSNQSWRKLNLSE